MKVRHIYKISDLTKEELLAIVKKAADIKANPKKYSKIMDGKSLLMIFEKPSLRTRLSFEVAMTQLGGHAIYYSVADSPLGKKETFSDTGKVISGLVDIAIARLNKRTDLKQLGDSMSVPLINALDDFAHPTQMMCDLLTILEKRTEGINGLKMAYCGDLQNNVTYDLMRMAALLGYEIRVAGPTGAEYDIEKEVLDECETLCKTTGGKVIVCKTRDEAVKDVDIIYCDSWMSYGIPKEKLEERVKMFMPYQIDDEALKLAKPDVIFMNCLPAARGMEQTASVIDGPHSVVFEEAVNRLHVAKSLMLFLLGLDEFKKE